MASVGNSESFTRVQHKKKTVSSNSKYDQDIRNLQRRIHSPKVDLIEREYYYLVRIELPGVDKKTIKINIKDSQIIFISGTKTISDIIETDKIIYKESKFDDFTRRVKLPGQILRFNNVLDFSNGVLNLTFDKKEPTVQQNDLPQTSDDLPQNDLQQNDIQQNDIQQLSNDVKQFNFKDVDKNTTWENVDKNINWADM
jgi:HSP20 family molecular chaperone IbpA